MPKMNEQPPSKSLSLITVGITICLFILFSLVPSAVRAMRPGLLSNKSYLPVVFKAWPPPTATPGPGRLLISEVLYNPSGEEPQSEWIEVYNAGGMSLDLSTFKLGDEETAGEQEGMFQFPAGTTIEPGQVVTVAYRAITFTNTYGFPPDYELNESDPFVPNMLKYSAWSGGNVQLDNTGDEIIIMNGSNDQVDVVSWGNSLTMNPPVAKVADGHSLERYPPNQDTDAAGDWIDQASPDPGNVDLTPPTPTPTITPSATATQSNTPSPTIPPSLVINEIHADPHSDPILGDANGDGTRDATDDEFLEIVNVTGSTVDITGWTVRDLVGVRHTFPEGSNISNGCAVIVFGGGMPTGEFGGSLVQTSSNGTIALNNSGDTIILFDLDETPVISYTYGSEGGDDQSLTRDPDITGPDPLVRHSTATGSGGALFSPGTHIDGTSFSGCSQANLSDTISQSLDVWNRRLDVLQHFVRLNLVRQ
jgi:hypothetical protein